MNEDQNEPTSGDFEVDVVYVNAYHETQHYGGPEEGGWWYHVGDPIASIPVRLIGTATVHWYDDAEYNERRQYVVTSKLDKADADKIAEISELIGETARQYDDNVHIRVEHHYGAPYPTTRPHYC